MGWPTTVYAAYDEVDAPLYIGVTGMWKTRFKAHRCTSPWWQTFDHVTLETLDGRTVGESREWERIHAERPFHNGPTLYPPRGFVAGSQPMSSERLDRQQVLAALKTPELCPACEIHAMVDPPRLRNEDLAAHHPECEFRVC